MSSLMSVSIFLKNQNFRKFHKKYRKDGRLPKLWRQMEIAFALSPEAHTQPNSSSMVELHFACCTFSYQHGFVNEKHVQRVKVPKSPGALGTGFTYAPVVLFELYLAMAIVR